MVSGVAYLEANSRYYEGDGQYRNSATISLAHQRGDNAYRFGQGIGILKSIITTDVAPDLELWITHHEILLHEKADMRFSYLSLCRS